MALMDFIKKQFIDVIHWTEQADGVLAHRFPMQDFEIQNGAKLTVRETQMALFVDEGQIADVFGPGLYTLNTETLPVLTYLKNWDKFFASPFKSDVYFFTTRQQLDRKWGTPNPITIRDKEFGIVRLRAFGIYSYHLADAKKFYLNVSGTREDFTSEEMEGQLRNTLIGSMTDLFGESGIAFLDMAANQEELGTALRQKMLPVFDHYGLVLDTLVVQNLSLPEELQKALDARISMNVLGDMSRYTQYQVATSIPLAAQNEGGLAGAGAGLGAGIGIGQAMAGAMNAASSPPQAAATAAVSAEEVMATLEKLHGLMTKGILTAEEFEAKKAELLKKLV
ncbi:MAG: SPFH domain-containing protein [Methylococcaceae bacterium]|nr:SPFH domain-containing protein [Methylococcaceae bacterium]